MSVNEVKNKPKGRAKYIILAILVILIVAAIFLIPRYNKYLNNKRAVEIKIALEALRNSVDETWKSSGTISGITLESALQNAGISPKIQEKWQFAIAWKLTDIYTTEMVQKLTDVSTNQMAYVAPYRMIMASAKAQNPLKEGTKIWLDGDTNSFHGFGVDDRIEPDWTQIFPNP
jgi:type II secretory pathway pseudopilin PulG